MRPWLGLSLREALGVGAVCRGSGPAAVRATVPTTSRSCAHAVARPLAAGASVPGELEPQPGVLPCFIILWPRSTL